jgi:hypothetical protein
MFSSLPKTYAVFYPFTLRRGCAGGGGSNLFRFTAAKQRHFPAPVQEPGDAVRIVGRITFGARAMRKVLFAAVATVALSAPFAASAEEITVRDHPNGNVTVREHAAPPPSDSVTVRERPNGSVVVRDHIYDRAPPGVVIREHTGPRGDSVTIHER